MPVSLRKNIDRPNSRYLVFTSAGDRAKVHHWLKGSRNFDLWICYYGNTQNKYEAISDFYITRRDGKFPNLYYVYQHWKSILDHYQAILVIDDDILISATDISRLFEIRERYDLWLLQPAYNPMSKISHPITRINPFTFLRFTNFVEVTCPLFRKDKLDAFMEIFDPVLMGWGIDYWFMDTLGPNINGKVAVVDAISCINPRDYFKGGQREIDLLQDTPARIRNWERIKEQYNIQVQEHKEFGAVRNSPGLATIFRAIKTYSTIGALCCLKAIRNKAVRSK